MFIGTNVYGWTQIAEKQGKDWNRKAAMKDAAHAGFNGWEDAFFSTDDVGPIVSDAAEAGLAMRTAYVPATLHKVELIEPAIEKVCEIAGMLKAHGITGIIVNPDTLEDKSAKSDAQITLQAQALNRLGEQLREMGLTLLYHSHDPEMQAAAREFHHMLAGTDPQNVRFCLDVHWVYRGAGNSTVALDDIFRLYGDRIEELHLRQSTGGIWSETVERGDLDFERIADFTKVLTAKPLIVIEQAYEPATPQSIDFVEAHRRSVTYIADVFAKLGRE